MEFSQPRLKSILLVLLEQPSNQYVSVVSLSTKFTVTTRTVRSDIKDLNNQLKQYGIEIRNKRGKGLYLDFDNRKSLEKIKVSLRAADDSFSITYGDRLKEFILLVLNGKNEINEIIDSLYISDSTFDKYLNDCRKILKRYNLSLKKDGDQIHVIGSESNIRSCIIDNLDNKRDKKYVEGFTETEKRVFENIDLDSLTTKVVNLLNELGNVEPSDYNNKNIVIHLALEIIRRKKDQNVVFNRDVPEVKESNYNSIKNFLMDIFNEYQVEYKDEELNYFIYHLALNYPQIINETKEKTAVDEKTINNAITGFLDRIKDMYVFNLLSDQQLRENLKKHLQLLLKVKRIDGNRKNPLLNVIISTFPLAYEMTVVGAPILEKQLGLELNEDEISFITLHVGASMERLYDNRWEKKKVALVCGSGTATAELLKARLQAEFSEYLNITSVYSLFDFQHMDLSNNDFVISTVPILNSKLPVIQVDLSNFQKDSFELYQYLVSISDESKLIMNLFDSKLIYLIDKLTTKQEILRRMIRDQRKYEYVNSNFEKNVFKREEMYSTAIGGGIAIPHPIAYSANQSKVSFARLSRPVKWDDKNEVKYVFLLSINKKDYPHIQQLFTLLVDLQSNVRFRKLIDKCKTIEETKDVLRTIIQEKHYGK